jgi:hypothetical protein
MCDNEWSGVGLHAGECWGCGIRRYEISRQPVEWFVRYSDVALLSMWNATIPSKSPQVVSRLLPTLQRIFVRGGLDGPHAAGRSRHC